MIEYLTTKADNSRYARVLYNALRMDIIHGQICMSKYTEWKRDQKTVAHEDMEDVLKEKVVENVNSPKSVLKSSLKPRSKLDVRSRSKKLNR